MPLIKTSKLFVFGVLHPFKINCKGDGGFYTALPASMADILNCGEIRSATLKGLEDELDKLIKQVHQLKTVTRKVICYSFKSKSYIFDEADEKCIFRSDEISFIDGVAMSIACGVYDEHTRTGGDKEFVRYERIKSAIPHSATFNRNGGSPGFGRWSDQVPWSEDNEAFFVRIVKSMDMLIMKMSALTKDPGQLQLAIQHQLALPNLNETPNVA